MASFTRHFPNALTIGNLICGCIGIIYARELPLYAPAYFVWMACLFDFADGFAARALNTASPIGKELDSLADMVSFGILPAVTMYTWQQKLMPDSNMAYSAFLLAIFAALRLAKFNVDENQKDSFIGLPTPAHALFITGLVFLHDPLDWITTTSLGLVGTTVLISLLMVVPLNLFALKFKNYTWTDNKLRFTFMGLAVLLVTWKRAEGVPLIILLYILLSLVEGMFSKK